MKTGHRDRAPDGPGARAAATLYGRDRVGCIYLFTVGDRWERSRDVFFGFLLLLAGEPVYDCCRDQTSTTPKRWT